MATHELIELFDQGIDGVQTVEGIGAGIHAGSVGGQRLDLIAEDEEVVADRGDLVELLEEGHDIALAATAFTAR